MKIFSVFVRNRKWLLLAVMIELALILIAWASSSNSLEWLVTSCGMTYVYLCIAAGFLDIMIELGKRQKRQR